MPAASVLPSAEIATDRTSASVALSVKSSLAERTRHALMVPSELPEISHCPSALKMVELTHDLWPLKVARNPPVFEFHNFTALSRLAVASHFPSGLKATLVTTPRCPRRI